MLFQPYTPAPHPSPASSVCSDCNYTVGLNVWLDVVTGMCGDIHETARQCFFLFFFSSLSSTHFKKCLSNIRPVDGSLGGCRRLLCWLMVTEMTDNSGVDPGVNLLAKQSKRPDRCPLGRKKANPSREVDSRLLLFTSHWAPSLICAGTDLKAPSPFDLSYLWKAAWECDTNVNKIYKSPWLYTVPAPLFFGHKSPGMFCWSENK